MTGGAYPKSGEVRVMDHTGASDIIFSGTCEFQAAYPKLNGALAAGKGRFPAFAWFAVLACKPFCFALERAG